MMRFYFPFIFAGFLVAWIIYRGFITKDLKKQLPSIFAGLFLMGVWGLIYWWVLA